MLLVMYAHCCVLGAICTLMASVVEDVWVSAVAVAVWKLYAKENWTEVPPNAPVLRKLKPYNAVTCAQGSGGKGGATDGAGIRTVVQAFKPGLMSGSK